MIHINKKNYSVFIMLMVILMLIISIPMTGVVMAMNLCQEQEKQLSDNIAFLSEVTDEMAQTSLNKAVVIASKTEKAPSVKGLKVIAAKKKLKESHIDKIKVEENKTTYKELVEKSDELFFGEVEKQMQKGKMVTLTIASADMEDELTAEMVNLGSRLAWPLPASHNITSHFGGRASPGGIGSTNHKGMDIAASTGTPIIAVKEGVVTKAEPYGGYGNCVVIEHNEEYKTLYGHMSKITCNVGDVVKPGDIIGRVGSTGISTGPHLHFGIIKNGMYVDPEPYFTGNLNVEVGEEVSENEPKKKESDEDVWDEDDDSSPTTEETRKPTNPTEQKKPTTEQPVTEQPTTEPTTVQPEPEKPEETAPTESSEAENNTDSEE